MGTCVAPVYACLFMAWLEELFLRSWKGTKPIHYKRFIDDIFFIWTGSVQELEQFLKRMNQAHSYIKFTSTFDTDTKTIPFLDTLVSLKGGRIVTDLYTKPTAVVQYLLPSSCHPKHVTKNIPYSLAFRLLRICSDPTSFEERLGQLKLDLMSRKYPVKVIDEAFNRVRSKSRKQALQKVTKIENGGQFLALTYHPALPGMSGIIRKHWGVMTGLSNELQRCFPKPSMVSYRRSKNLGDHMFRAKISSRRGSNRIKNGYKPCNQGCQCCWHSVPATTHTCPKTGQTWTMDQPID